MAEQKLKSLAVKGIAWTGFSQVVGQILTFIITAILARALAPRDFGLLGMALIFTGLILMLNELGLGAAIIQKKDISEQHLSTVFWVSVFSGFLAWFLALAVAPLAAYAVHNRQVINLIPVLAVSFIISSFGVVHKTILNKQLNFQRLAYAEIGSIAAYGITSILLSLAGYGVWSLVAGLLMQSFVEVIILWLVLPWHPQLLFDVSCLRELFSFGVNVWAFNFVNYGRENVDYFLIGRLLGPTALGFYTLAYSLANLPRRRLMSIITKVTFPAFAQVQDENAKIRYGYLRTVTYTALITFPLLAGLSVVAPEFIVLVYGQKWQPVIKLVQVLAGVGMMYSIGSPVGSIFLAKGRPDLQLKLSLLSVVALSAFVLIGVHWGMLGVAYAILIYAVLFVVLTQAVANLLIDLNMADFVFSFLRPLVGSLTMYVVLFVYRSLATIKLHLSSGILLTSSISLGALVYLLVLFILKVPELGEVMPVIRDQLVDTVGSIKRRLWVKPAIDSGKNKGA